MQLRDLLAGAIRDGSLPPGARLHIGQLADEHDVSRPTVSHALRLMEADGLVTRWPGIGWTVN